MLRLYILLLLFLHQKNWYSCNEKYIHCYVYNSFLCIRSFKFIAMIIYFFKDAMIIYSYLLILLGLQQLNLIFSLSFVLLG